ncbi:hypothetical protein AURDEDRAFT_149319 [Auricularia subglabra TFB-10046 SS5]|nr:hypothetical protein AURDEDRAFT_149319 [Auricularia subglabra TFB-10046 SS5]
MNNECRLSAYELAECFMFLPFRDRITVSHVSRFWRATALSYPSVWCDIQISRCANPSEVFRMALSRAGQLTLDVSYFPDQPSPDPEVYVAMAEAMNRFRSIAWGCTTEGEPLDVPAPLLESFETCTSLHLPENVLGGKPARLRRLHLADLFLPTACPVLSTVVDLKAKIPTEPSVAIRFRALFDLCPWLESLELEYVQHAPDDVLPPGPAPKTLKRLHLHSFRRTDLVKVYMDWRTQVLKDVHFTITNPPSPEHAVMLVGAHELSLFYEEEYERSVNIAIGPDGWRHTIVYPNILREDAVPEGTDAIRNAHAVFDNVHTLNISLSVIYNWLSHAPWPRGLRHLTINVHEEAWVALGIARSFPWYCLDCVASFHAFFPALESLTLVVRTWKQERPLTLDHAHALLEKLASLDRTGLPDVRVQGLSEDVVRTIERLDLDCLRAFFDV